MINYILIAHFIGAGPWSHIRIEKPHAFIADCLSDGRQWHEQTIQGNLAIWPKRGSTVRWECVRVAR